ncbi:MAG TPA: hypothetical protein ENK62_06015 [Chromatiales bacterium]|nr:hypothetical protein [Chromatiales bacterium]
MFLTSALIVVAAILPALWPEWVGVYIQLGVGLAVLGLVALLSAPLLGLALVGIGIALVVAALLAQIVAT